MRPLLGCLLMVGVVWGQLPTPSSLCTKGQESVYGFSLRDVGDTRDISLADFRNKVLLVVNTATFWGATYQYTHLNALKDKYAGQDFDILGVPSNNFGLQEPGANDELLNGIKYVRPGGGYVPNFNLTVKTDVNGLDEHELFTHLKDHCPGHSKTIAATSGMYWSPVSRDDLTWNFEKFLIDRQGFVHSRYAPSVEPARLEPIINELLKNETTVKSNLMTVLKPRVSNWSQC